MSLSLCCVSGGPPRRLEALLEVFRDEVDEIVVALDERVDTRLLGRIPVLADRLLRIPYAPPLERTLPWLHRQCTGDWIFRIDDDELPSAVMLGELRALTNTQSVTHYWHPRRWLYPNAAEYIDEEPWVPDFQLRLVRNDPSLVRFTGITHEPVRAVGPGRFLDASLYHADLLRPVAERSQKGRRYESDRPGLRIAGRALNQAYYLPELRESLRTARVPAEDLRLIERIHGAPEPESSDAATFPLASREEIDAHWPARVGAETDFDGEVVLRRGPSRMVAGGREIYEIQVRNSGTRMWQWGLDGIPPIRIAYRWFAPDGSVVVPDGFRTGLPADLGPGETHIVPVHVEAPIHEGPLILELNLVHEGVRWFERPSRQTVEVVPPRCVGIVFASDAGSAIQVAQAVVAEAPELEPLLLSDETDLPYRTAHDINAADVVALIVAEQFEGLDGKLRAARAANIPVLFPDQGIDELIAALHALEQPGVAAAPAGTDSEDDGGRE